MSWIPFIGVPLESDKNMPVASARYGAVEEKTPFYPTTTGTADTTYRGDDTSYLEIMDIGLTYFNLRGNAKGRRITSSSTTNRRRRLFGEDDSSDLQAEYLRGLEMKEKQQRRMEGSVRGGEDTTNLNMASWSATSFGALILVSAAVIAYKRRIFNTPHESDL